jgi:hypothetical protein
VPLTEVELNVVHCQASDSVTGFQFRNKTASIKMFAADAGVELSKKLLYLALKHHQLASTTVTGIVSLHMPPMCIGANRGSSPRGDNFTP